MKRFTFGDHADVVNFASLGYHGTRSERVSLEGKLLDVLIRYDDFMTRLMARPGNQINADGSRAEFSRIMNAAHQHAPGMFPAAPPQELSWHQGEELALARHQITMLRQLGFTFVAGAANKEYVDTEVELHDGPCGVRIKAGTMTLYDMEHAAVLRPNNWETAQPVPPKKGAPYARVKADGKMRKVSLAHFVWTECAKRIVPDDHVIVPINNELYDVRMRNLTFLPGSAKNHKSRFSNALPDDVDANALGMRFLPPGVTVCGNMIKLPDHNKKKFTSGPKKTKTACMQAAIDHLRQNQPDFESENAVFQQLCSEFDAARRLLAV
jgi:hypothetical protein